MKNIMSRAWEIAREAVQKFGGKVKMYFAEALRLAWAEAKTAVSKIIPFSKLEKELGDNYTINSWYKYGKERIYINDHRNVSRGYLELLNGTIVSVNVKTYLNFLDKYVDYSVNYSA